MKAFEQEFLNFLEGIYKSLGFDSLSAKLYSQLFIEPEEIAMEDLSKRTGYSLASISNKMNLMEGIGVAKRIKKPGTKKVFYYVDKDLINIQKNKMKIVTEKMIDPAKKMLPKITELKEKEKLDKREKEKLTIIQNYYTQMIKLEKALKAFIEKLE
ncbi:hypothetical protein GOV08_01980 [Candidatus Woesearchaeota archaeon]|nr:hypothetical protein [Candidatus Woesearchaeota archaeon]